MTRTTTRSACLAATALLAALAAPAGSAAAGRTARLTAPRPAVVRAAAGAPVVTFTVRPPTVSANVRFLFSGRATVGGVPLAHAPVAVLEHDAAGGARYLGRGVTRADGTFDGYTSATVDETLTAAVYGGGSVTAARAGVAVRVGVVDEVAAGAGSVTVRGVATPGFPGTASVGVALVAVTPAGRFQRVLATGRLGAARAAAGGLPAGNPFQLGAALPPGAYSLAVAVSATPRNAASYGPTLHVAVAGAPATMTTDPSLWSNQALAAQLVVASVDQSQLGVARSWAAQGLGGIVLLGSSPADLGAQLRAVRAASRVPVLVTSDEEGGEVQRLAAVINPLPSAAYMGAHYGAGTIAAIAWRYGARMRALGVDTDLAPDSDIGVPGYFIAQEYRAWSSNPAVVAADARAWAAGLRAAGVMPVVKHWPGHGQTADSHLGPAVTPPLSVLQGRDMVPFTAEFAAGDPAVMVGHLTVPGLTGGLPATLSPAAYRYLRGRAGARILVLTDSMTMGAVTSALGLTSPAASLRALQAGADAVLTDDGNPFAEVAAIRSALDTGAYSRAAAVASARRMVAAKRLVGDR